MRGKVYGMGTRRSTASRNRRDAENEKKHNDMLDARRLNPLINIWQSDFRLAKPNNYDFCMNLNSTWFHGIRNSGQNMDLSTEDLQKIKEMYMQQVYTPYKFPNTWRDQNSWQDAHGNSLQLKDISEEEIKKYYFDRCPQPSVDILDVLSFLSLIPIAFFTIVFFGVVFL
jgi:hypothetical protein